MIAMAQISIEAISLIIALLSFAYGINTWRREYAGKKRLDATENILASFYEAQDTLAAIRFPLIRPGEGQSRPKREDETKRESEILDRVYVAIERIQTHSRLFSEISASKYRFMVLFGKDSRKPFDDLNAVIRSIYSTTQLLGDSYWGDRGEKDGHQVDPDARRAFLEQKYTLEDVIWERGQDNITTIQINNCVTDIESYLEKETTKLSRNLISNIKANLGH